MGEEQDTSSFSWRKTQETKCTESTGPGSPSPTANAKAKLEKQGTSSSMDSLGLPRRIPIKKLGSLLTVQSGTDSNTSVGMGLTHGLQRHIHESPQRRLELPGCCVSSMKKGSLLITKLNLPTATMHEPRERKI